MRPRGARQGINDYTGWFAGDKDMAGNYFGYDGPCPPWNDEIPHRYVFTLYALDVAAARDVRESSPAPTRARRWRATCSREASVDGPLHAQSGGEALAEAATRRCRATRRAARARRVVGRGVEREPAGVVRRRDERQSGR